MFARIVAKCDFWAASGSALSAASHGDGDDAGLMIVGTSVPASGIARACPPPEGSSIARKSRFPVHPAHRLEAIDQRNVEIAKAARVSAAAATGLAISWSS
jgi:hypothetical protein